MSRAKALTPRTALRPPVSISAFHPSGLISGLFHRLDDDGRRSYAAAVHRATRPGATLLLSCFSEANPVGEEPRPAVSAETLRDVLGGAGWDIATLEPATLPGELDGVPVEMAFWYLRAQRR